MRGEVFPGAVFDRTFDRTIFNSVKIRALFPVRTCGNKARILYFYMRVLQKIQRIDVQVLLSALNNKNPNRFSTGERVRIFGFLQQSKMKIQMSAASRFFSRDAALFNSFGQWQLPAQPPLSSW